DVRARAAVAGELIAPLRILRLDEQVALLHAAIVRVVVPVRVAAIDLAVRVDDEALKPRVVGPRARAVQETALNRVPGRRRAGDLDLAALVRIDRGQADAGLRERDLIAPL